MIDAEVVTSGRGEDFDLWLEDIEVRDQDGLPLTGCRLEMFLREHGTGVQEQGAEAYFALRGCPPDPGPYRTPDGRLIDVIGSGTCVDSLGQHVLVVIAKFRCYYGEQKFLLVPVTEWTDDYKSIMPEPMAGELRQDGVEYVPLTSKLLPKRLAMDELRRRRLVRQEQLDRQENRWSASTR